MTTSRISLLSPDRLRFWSKTTWQGDCLVWISPLNKEGYPYFKVGGKSVRSHKWIYEQVFGTIPESWSIDHLCRNRACVLLEHLEAVPHGVNVRRSPRFQEQMARTHCPKGHPYSGDNLFMQGTRRKCRACQRQANRESYRKRVAK